MKRLIVCVSFLVVCFSGCFGQEWDELKVAEYGPYNINKWTVQGEDCLRKIEDHYTMGNNCFKAGIATFSVGSILTIVGGIVYHCGTSNLNTSAYPYYNSARTPNQSYLNQQTAGIIMMGIGGSLVSVSLPLFCFGDNMKRNANNDYRLFNLMMK